MKTIKSIATILLILIVLSFSLLSCGTMGKSALPCPEVSNKMNNKLLSHQKVSKKKIPGTKKESNKLLAINHSKVRKGKDIENKTFVPTALSPIERAPNIDKSEYSKGLITSTDNHLYLTDNKLFLPPVSNINTLEESVVSFTAISNICDTIFLRSGAMLIGKVEEIGQTEIKYRKCNNLTGPIISIAKSEVTSISYSNGTRDFIDPSDSSIPNRTIPTYNNNTVLKTEGLGIAGFASSLVGLFIGGIPLGALAVIFGSLSLSKIKKNPQKYKGRGFAIASIIIGIIDVVAMIIILALAV